MLGTILGYVDRISLGIDVVTEIRSFYGSFDGSNDVKLEFLLLVESLVSTDDKVLGSDEGIKLVISDGKVIGTIHGDLYGITLGVEIGTELGYLYGSFHGTNDGKL